MSTSTSPQHDLDLGVDEPRRRLTTETKAATKTTELVVYVLAVVAVIVTANFYDGDGSTGGDPFGATTAMRYVVYLTVAYLVARGLAKSGSPERYDG